MTDTRPNAEASLAFLRRWAPEGPWVVTSIQVDRKALDTKTFGPKSEEQLRQWLERYNTSRNIYFHVNPPLRDLSKKAEREDIKEVAWLHVDIDPRAGEDLAEERERALGLLTSNLPSTVPPPTVVVFSGGGYQGFWRLEQPIAIDGMLELAEDAKRYNQQLELLFGADNCHNIDRIMRLPGTLNIPDAKKIKKGREVALAEVVEFNDLSYPISAFTAAPVVQMPEELPFSGSQGSVKVSGNVTRLADVSELDQWSVPDRVKVIIVQGRHPEETKAGDDSRSSWLFDAVCQLARCDVPDEVIFSVITDPDFGISESVIEKGSNAEKYAIRQIERAKEEAISPWLRKLNEQFAVIGNMGGKCRVVEEVMDHSLKRTRLTRQSFEDFRNRFMHILVQVGLDPKGNPVNVPLGKFWLLNPNRRQYETIVFAPGHEVKGAYNMWKGFACVSRPGDCGLFLEHIRENVCSGNEDYYNYLIGWLARAVQHPDSPGEVAIVLRGARGVGKSVFAKEVGKLFGRHFLQVSNPSHLVGNFNSHLRDVVVLFADEAFYAGDKKHESILKTLITEESITIEAKGVDAEAAPNYVHLIMASNSMHVIPAGGDERRFFMLEVGKGHQQDHEYFERLRQQMDNGGREALLHFLLTYDLSTFEVRRVPQTEALYEQKLLSLTVEEEWWYQKLVEGRLLQTGDSWESEVRKDELIDDYVFHTKRFNISRRGTSTMLGRFLGKLCPKLDAVQRMASWEEPTGDGFVRKVQRRTYFWQMPTLEVVRQRWEELYGPEEWPEINQQPPLGDEGIPF